MDNYSFNFNIPPGIFQEPKLGQLNTHFIDKQLLNKSVYNKQFIPIPFFLVPG